MGYMFNVSQTGRQTQSLSFTGDLHLWRNTLTISTPPVDFMLWSQNYNYDDVTATYVNSPFSVQGSQTNPFTAVVGYDQVSSTHRVLNIPISGIDAGGLIVDWGDGLTETFPTGSPAPTHDYAYWAINGTSGTATVRVYGNFTTLGGANTWGNPSSMNSSGYADVLSVTNWGDNPLIANLSNAFTNPSG